MPITFEQPAPVSPQISAAAGAAEQFTRFAPTLAAQQRALADVYAQQYQTSAQMANANADRMQRGSEFNAQLQARQQEGVQQRQQAADEMSMRGQLAQQQQQGEMDQLQARARLAQEAQEAELTQREKIEMNRLQMAAGAIRDNPDLADEEKNALLTQVYAKVNPYQARMAKSQALQEELQNRQLQQRIAEQDIMSRDREAFKAGNLQAMTRDVKDEQGNVLGSFVMIPGEKAHYIDKNQMDELRQARIERMQDRTRAEQERKEQAALKQQQYNDQKMADYHHKMGAAFADFEHKAAIQAETVAKDAGPNFDKEAYRENRLNAMKAAYREGNPPPTPPAGTSISGGAGAQRPEGAPDSKPLTGEGAVPNEKQAADLKQFDAFRSVFAGVPRDRGQPHAEEIEAKKAADKAEALYRKYGDPLNMPEADARAFVDAVQKAGQLAAAFRRRISPTGSQQKSAPGGRAIPGLREGFTWGQRYQ